MNLTEKSYIKSLVQLMSESDLSEISIEEKQVKLTLKREYKPKFEGAIVASTSERIPPPNLRSRELRWEEAGPSAATESEQPTDRSAEKGVHHITTPLVGTFYSSPSPDAPPYVQKGDRVAKGQTVCIVEAMKLMNEIASDVSGVVEEILCENASPVEFGSKLFAIRVG